MATGTQVVEIHKSSDNSLAYTCTTPRNTATDPLTTDGNAAFAVKAQTGQLRLTVDNGAVIPIGTIPPLIKPDAPVSGAVPAFEQKIQAEVASGTGTAGTPGVVGDGNSRGPYSNNTQYLLYSITGVQKTAANYNLRIRYTSNVEAGGNGSIIVNGDAPISFPYLGKAGGFDNVNITISLNEGNNTIRIEGKDGQPFYMDYIEVTRPASS